MSLEKLIEEIPDRKTIGKNKEPTGLCFRFSVSNKLWLIAYGTRRGVKLENKEVNDLVGFGYSIIEALDDFKSKIKNYNYLK